MSAPRTIKFIETIGTGGFGAVYLAEVHGRGGFVQRVAVKLLFAEQAASSDIVARHRDEARLLALLNHDNIVKVMDMVEIDGRPALLMEVVDGVDCGALLRTAPLSPRAAAEVVVAVSSALRFAHETPDPTTGRPLAVVHRDIKPANILISRHGGVKVLDFGIARGDFDREGRTESVQFGTARYMAPEQWLYGHSNDRVDIYALGITWLELLSGRQLARAPLQPGPFEAHIDAAIDHVVQAWPEAHASAARALLRGMCAWAPERRPNAAAVHAAALSLAELLTGPSLARLAPAAVPPLIAARKAKHQGENKPADAALLPAASRPRPARTAAEITLPTPMPTLLDGPRGGPTLANLLTGTPDSETGPVADATPQRGAEEATAPTDEAEAAPPGPAALAAAPTPDGAPTAPHPSPAAMIGVSPAVEAPAVLGTSTDLRFHSPNALRDLLAHDNSASSSLPPIVTLQNPALRAGVAPDRRGLPRWAMAAVAALAVTGVGIWLRTGMDEGASTAHAEAATPPAAPPPAETDTPPAPAAAPPAASTASTAQAVPAREAGAPHSSTGPSRGAPRDAAPPKRAIPGSGSSDGARPSDAATPRAAPASGSAASTGASASGHTASTGTPTTGAPTTGAPTTGAPTTAAPTTGTAADAGASTVPVRFTSTPAGALVAVDDQGMGAAPTAAVPLRPGRHRVRMVLAGQVCAAEVNLSAIGANTVHCDLATGTLSRGR